MSSLYRHRDLIDKEATSFDIVEASNTRRKIDEEVEKSEQERSSSHLQAVLSWLAVDDRLQEDDLWRLNHRRFPDTCQWLFNAPQYQTWLMSKGKYPILWLWGIPGSGKSLIQVRTYTPSPSALVGPSPFATEGASAGRVLRIRDPDES